MPGMTMNPPFVSLWRGTTVAVAPSLNSKRSGTPLFTNTTLRSPPSIRPPIPMTQHFGPHTAAFELTLPDKDAGNGNKNFDALVIDLREH